MNNLAAGQRFLQEHRQQKVVIAPHPDADGLSGAALIQRWLQGPVTVVCPDKGESIHTEHFRDRLREAAPEALVVIDQGSRDEVLLPGVPRLTIDHHIPSGRPDGVLVSSALHTPNECASHLCYLLIGEPEEWGWLTAVGIMGDYGPQAAFAPLRAAKARYTSAALQETVALINAGRRSSRFDWPPALHLLLTADSPRQIAGGEWPEVAQLQQDRMEVNQEMRRARRAKPLLADPWAVIPFASPCLIHPMLSVSWLGRLKEHYVVAANFGYRKGFVHFSVRSALPVDLLALLRDLAPEGLPGEWGHGHQGATGGAVARGDFLFLLLRMGFTPEQVGEIEHAVRGH